MRGAETHRKAYEGRGRGTWGVPPRPLARATPRPQDVTETTPAAALTGRGRAGIMKGKVGHGSKSGGNNTCCCSKRGGGACEEAHRAASTEALRGVQRKQAIALERGTGGQGKTAVGVGSPVKERGGHWRAGERHRAAEKKSGRRDVEGRGGRGGTERDMGASGGRHPHTTRMGEETPTNQRNKPTDPFLTKTASH